MSTNYDLQALFAYAEAHAREKYDGHLTIMKFTTNWKVMFGTPADDVRDRVRDLPGFKTLSGALESLLRQHFVLPERDPELERMHAETAEDHAVAVRNGWPRTLIKALDDSYCYLVKIRGERVPWEFESASVISPEFVALQGVRTRLEPGVQHPWPYDFIPRAVNVRVDAIEWITDAES